MSNPRYERYKSSTRDLKPRKGYQTEPNGEFVISYLALRKSIGLAGVLLPIILLIGSSVNNYEILPSLSHYFHSSMKIIFVGFIFAIAFFLWTYNGNSMLEKYICSAAAICALIVAIIPTKNDIFPLEAGVVYTIDNFSGFICPAINKANSIVYCHLIFAAIFFILLSILVLHCFIKDERASIGPTGSRITLYKICGWGMLASIAIIALNFWFTFCENDFPITFVFESITLELFGLAWLVKGEILKPLAVVNNS